MLRTFDRAAKAVRVERLLIVRSPVRSRCCRYRSRAQPLRPPLLPWEDFDFLPFALAFFCDVPEPPP